MKDGLRIIGFFTKARIALEKTVNFDSAEVPMTVRGGCLVEYDRNLFSSSAVGRWIAFVNMEEAKMKKRTVKRMLKWSGMTLGILLVVIVVGAGIMFGTFVKAAHSIEKFEEGLYSMEFVGDYGFDEFLAKGGAKSDSEVADYLVSFLSHGFYKIKTDVQTGNFGCSTLYTQDVNGTYFFGRNYDWSECRTMIVHTKPKNGYESISTCCLDFLGFRENYVPDGSMMERMQSIAAIYVPLDGMNSEGLVIADLMAGDREETHQRTGKTNLTTTTAIRLLLDRAANVDEAIALLKQYDMNSSIDSAHHFSMADAQGKSVVVEYVNGEMMVTETKIVTNHYLAACEKQGVGSEQSHQRYEALAAHTGPAGEMEVRDLLESVSQKNYPRAEDRYEKTMWSIVYCPEGRCADFYFAENYSQSYGLDLSDQGSFWVRKHENK